MAHLCRELQRPLHSSASATQHCKSHISPGKPVQWQYRPNQSVRPDVRAKSKIGDELLDFVTAGPKLRKWYGQGERLPRDGGSGDEDPEEPQQQEEDEEPTVRDAILVTDAESSTGELVLLQLILARVRVKACVRNTAAAKTSYGPYVEPLSFDTNNPKAWRRMLRDVSAVVCVGAPAALPTAAAKAGVEHLVLLSSAGVGRQGGFDLGAFMASSEDKLLRDPSREDALRRAGLPLTIVRAAKIRDAPGGASGISLRQGPAGPSGDSAISREDIARVIVQALQQRPAGVLEFQVVQEGPAGASGDLEQLFSTLQEQA